MGEKDFFSDYFDCCKKSSWNTDICILQAPSYLTAEPTPSPSESPTPNPSDRPTPNPTMNPTAAPNKPSTSPITSNPTGKPTQDLIDECDARLWHPSSDFSMCSNRWVIFSPQVLKSHNLLFKCCTWATVMLSDILLHLLQWRLR